MTNEAHIFDGRDFSKGIIDKLRLPGIDGVQLAHSPASHIAAYVPEIKVCCFALLPATNQNCSGLHLLLYFRDLSRRHSLTFACEDEVKTVNYLQALIDVSA